MPLSSELLHDVEHSLEDLQWDVNFLEKLLSYERKHRKLNLPEIAGAAIDEQPILFSDLVAASLRAVGKANAKLKGAEGLGLGGDPIEFKFTGSFHGVIGDSKDILVKLKLEKEKGEKNANGQ